MILLGAWRTGCTQQAMTIIALMRKSTIEHMVIDETALSSSDSDDTSVPVIPNPEITIAEQLGLGGHANSMVISPL